jgi:signal transduction histidine kinase
MNSKSKIYFYNLIIIISIFIGAFGIQRLYLKSNLPFEYDTHKNNIETEEVFGDIDSGAVLKKIDSYPISSEFQLEFYLDSKSQGDTITLETAEQNNIKAYKIVLVPCYEDGGFIFISLLVGLTFLLCSVYVINKKVNDPSARVLFWVLLLNALATVTSPGKLDTDFISYLVRLVHALSFIFGISAFLHFSIVFPQRRKHAKSYITLSYMPVVIVSILLSFSIIKAINTVDDYWVNYYSKLWDVLYLILSVSMVIGITIFYYTVRKLESKADKAKVKWILWGISIGVFPYLAFFVVPGILNLHISIPEDYSLLLLIIVPVSFATAVIKYHLFDIELIIKRSIVYSILTGFILIIYFVIIAFLSSLFQEISGSINKFVSLVAAVTIAFIFNPARNKIQKFVNRTFYREKYNFEHAVSSFTKEIGGCSTLSMLGLNIIGAIDKHIPIEKIGVFILDEKGEKLKVLSEKNIDKVVQNIEEFQLQNINSDFRKPFAMESAIQQGVDANTSLSEILSKLELCIAIPLELKPESFTGAIVLGNKLSGLKYSSNDFELLNVFASEAGISISKLQLQELLVLNEIEKHKLEELNSLKSFFVSSVSHDLKTPVTSIKMFTELLKHSATLPEGKKKEYLEIINGESENLTRLIENILDISKMESGTKTYRFELLDFNKLICSIVTQMDYRFRMNKFKIDTHFPEENLKIMADEDSVTSAVTNLLNNSIKYSNRVRDISVTTGREDGCAFVNVSDKGIGIPEEQLGDIFTPYFRANYISTNKIKGTGLGLAIVKHVMDTHKGSIKIKSTLQAGTSIILLFPLYNEELIN